MAEFDDDEPLELNGADIVANNVEGGDDAPVFAFDEEEEEADDSPAIRRLRERNKELTRSLQEARRPQASPSDDPEPQIPARPNLEALNYDQDRFDAEAEAREKAILERAAWERRNAERKTGAERAAEEQARKINQQKASLGVSDYDQRSAAVKEALSDQQLAVLINAADNPARLIYALGRSESRLGLLSAEGNLARFAANVGRMEKEIKEMKRKGPPPETRVRGATAPIKGNGADKKLEALEKAAEKSGDRSAVAAYRRELKMNHRAA